MASLQIGSGPGIEPFDINLNGSDHTVANVVSELFFVFSWIVGLASIFALLYAGWRYMSSDGDPTKAAEARQQLMFAAIGIVVAAASYLIYSATLNSLNV